MVLESTMICVDNSDYMRNGDFLPTRMFAQQDAVGMVFHAKTRSNPENNCGLICSADVKVISTLTSDSSKILTQLRALEPNGDSKFDTMIKMAHLALKHRQSKNHKMRIVAFVGSPVHCGDKDIVKLAKRLKKEKVNVDVVSFGEGEDNTHVLSQFVNTLNGKDGSGSHMVTVPTGPHLSDALISSPILQGEDGTAPVGLSTGSGFEFGVDPNEDPELAMALRVSMDEQRALQQQQGGSAAPEGGPPGAQLPGAADTDDSMLQQTLGSAGASVPMTGSDIAAVGAVPDFGAMTEEEQIAYAMRMSMADQGEAAPTPMETDSPAQNEAADRYMDVVSDPAFLQSVLESLPGVDPNSEEVRRAMGAHQPESGASQRPEDDDSKPQDPKSK